MTNSIASPSANNTDDNKTTPSPSERNADLWELLRRSKSRVAQMHAPRQIEVDESDSDDSDSDPTLTPSPLRDYQQERREIEGLLKKSKHRLSFGYDLDKVDQMNVVADSIQDDSSSDDDNNDNKDNNNNNNNNIDDVPEIDIDDVPEIDTTIPKTPQQQQQPQEEEEEEEETPIPPETPTPVKRNRAERKNRKMMQKMGMRKVSGITHATFQTTRQGLFYIEQPDVYVSSNHLSKKHFIIFGQTYQTENPEVSPEDRLAYQNLQAIQQAARQVTNNSNNNNGIPVIPEEDGEVGEAEGLDPDDIKLVMNQAFCSRNKAIQALKEYDDIVDAVMALRI